MKALMAAVAVLCMAVSAAAEVPCGDQLPNVLNVGIPRTALTDDQAKQLSQTLRTLFVPAYADCRSLQINLAFGSDYEVLDWLERGSVDAGIVPHLSLFLLTHRNRDKLRELNEESSRAIGLLRPLAPAPECRRYDGRNWKPCAGSAIAAYDALIADLAAGKPVGHRRVMFASHLSSTGFLHPIERAASTFARLGASDEEAEVLWQQLFDAARFRIDSAETNPFALALQEEKVKHDLTVIAFPGEETLRDAPAPATGPAYAQHFVVTSAAEKLLAKATFIDPWNGEQPSVDPAVTEMLAREHPPRAFETLANAEPTFGVRTFGFTVNESLRLLRQQQRSSGLQELALVLPGGGVKAAYQSRIIDELYGKGALRNAESGGAAPVSALTVRSVLGTSGGALLGYFVAQLSDKGPFNLFDILWKPDGDYLNAEHVFDWTDMPRYFSIAWTFIIFCILLAVITGTHTSAFYKRAPAQIGAWRWRLLTVLAVFIAVPILIRFATGTEAEHVPVIEGLFYSILTVLVMFADQCLVYTRWGGGERKLWPHVMALAAVGSLCVFASFFGVSVETLQQAVTFNFAFFMLSAIFLGAPLLLLWVSGMFGEVKHRVVDVTGSLAAVIVLCAFGIPGRLPRQVPHILGLLVLIGLAVFAYWYSQQPVRKRIVATVQTFLTLFATAVLCWSKDVKPRSWSPTLEYFGEAAFDGTRLASFLASIGALLLVMAAMVWVYQQRRYALRNGENFALGLGLLLVHSVVTSVLVFLTTQALPGRVHNLEMTGSFWLSLTLFGALVAVLILVAAPRWPLAKRAVEFLRSEHPNGALLPRRYARMLGVATLSVFWWNVVVAPAFYGNRVARKYLDAAVGRFDAAFLTVNGRKPSEDERGFVPTAKFVAPTNTLDVENSTRYFMFETPGHAPEVSRRRIAGALWNVYETTPRLLADNDCRTLIDVGCIWFVHDVIFSSGSPFPIFAAHRVDVPGEKDAVYLIDGGYSNDIPIDAARQINAQQALIVHSSSPFSAVHDHHGDEGEGKLSMSPGMLIQNIGRLPAFMFERGQQVDRISRQNLFVVALAPKLDPDEPWPGLAQFDEATVRMLYNKANANLYERIGFVESWGEPRFRFSVQVAGVAGVKGG